MRGELDKLSQQRKARLDKAMKAPYPRKKKSEETKTQEERIREAGW